jgi:hypothetical protein
MQKYATSLENSTVESVKHALFNRLLGRDNAEEEEWITNWLNTRGMCWRNGISPWNGWSGRWVSPS